LAPFSGVLLSQSVLRFVRVLYDLLSALSSLSGFDQTRSVAVKSRPKNTMEGSSEMAAPRSVFDVFMS
jgi:hypothetical protein